jgi:anti-sigma-K factor RskA
MAALGPDELDELLGAYALDAVDDDERQAVEDYLESSPRARAEVADHREVAALLAGTGSQAPDHIWTRIAGSLEEAPPQLRLAIAPTVPLTSEPGSRAETARTATRRWLVATVAVAAAVILVLGALVVRQGTRIGDIEDDLAAAVKELESVDIEAAAGLASVDPANQTVDLVGDGDTVVAVLEPDGSGYLMAGRLQPLGDDRTYQLWGIRGETPVSLGVLGPAPQVVAFRADGSFDALAISEEAAGGAVAPTAPSLVGEVS